MEGYLIWLLGGLALVIAELVTGTFYLLVLGVAAFGRLAKESNTLIVPANAADIAALITTAMTVMDKTRQTQAAAKGA